MLLRQVQASPLQGHHLRALRRRGDAPEGAPRAHGPHRPRRAGLAHLVLQGRAEPHRLPARHRTARAREGPLLRRLDRDHGRRREAQEGPERPREQGRGREGADRRRPRRVARRARGPAQEAPQLLHEERRAELRRGRRVLDPRPVQLGRGAGHSAARGGARARLEALPRRRDQDHDRGLEEDPRARPQRRDPRRPPADAEGAGVGRERRRSRSARRSRASTRSSPRRPARRRARSRSTSTACSTACSSRRRRSTRTTRSSSPAIDEKQRREGARPRQGPPPRGAGAGRAERERRRDPRADERPLPAHRREDPEGGSRRDRPVVAEGARDVPRHRVAAPGRARGGRGLEAAARRHVAALQGPRAEADHRRRAAVPRAEGPLRLGVRVRRLLHGRHGRGGDPRAAQGPRPRRRGRRRSARRSRPRRARSSSARSSG